MARRSFTPGSAFTGTWQPRRAPGAVRSLADRYFQMIAGEEVQREVAPGPRPDVPKLAATGAIWGIPVVSEHNLDTALSTLLQQTPDRVADKLRSPRERAEYALEQRRAEQQAHAEAAAAAEAANETDEESVDAEVAEYDWVAHWQDLDKPLDELLEEVTLEDAEAHADDDWEAA